MQVLEEARTPRPGAQMCLGGQWELELCEEEENLGLGQEAGMLMSSGLETLLVYYLVQYIPTT